MSEPPAGRTVGILAALCQRPSTVMSNIGHGEGRRCRTTTRAAAFCLAIACFAGMGGCARHSHQPVAAPSGRYTVSVAAAEFFRYGPQQGGGADRKLPRNTVVNVSGHAFGYSKVRLNDGTEGYVAADDLRPASAARSGAAAKTSNKPPEHRVVPQYTEPALPPPERSPTAPPSR